VCLRLPFFPKQTEAVQDKLEFPTAVPASHIVWRDESYESVCLLQAFRERIWPDFPYFQSCGISKRHFRLRQSESTGDDVAQMVEEPVNEIKALLHPIAPGCSMILACVTEEEADPRHTLCSQAVPICNSLNRLKCNHSATARVPEMYCDCSRLLRS